VSVLSDFTKAVTAAMQDAYAGVRVNHGRRPSEQEGGVSDKARIYVFAPGFAEWSDPLFAVPAVHVQHYLPRSRQLPIVDPPDPTELEDAAYQLAAALQPFQDTILPDRSVIFRVASVEIDHDDWGVEAILTGWMNNPATHGA
jgi:hypothetical protein